MLAAWESKLDFWRVNTIMPNKVVVRCKHCGRAESTSGRPFDEQTLKQHIGDAHQLSPTRGILAAIREDRAFQLAEDIAGDESDGVFLGILDEMGGW